MLVNQFLREKAGQSLRAEIYSENNGYNVKYYVNENMQTQRFFSEENISQVESQAQEWLSSIGVLKG